MSSPVLCLVPHQLEVNEFSSIGCFTREKKFEKFSYRVMRSDRNNFCGDVVFYSFNKVSRDKDNILDQRCEKQICLDFYYDDFDYL